MIQFSLAVANSSGCTLPKRNWHIFCVSITTFLNLLQTCLWRISILVVPYLRGIDTRVPSEVCIYASPYIVVPYLRGIDTIVASTATHLMNPIKSCTLPKRNWHLYAQNFITEQCLVVPYLRGIDTLPKNKFFPYSQAGVVPYLRGIDTKLLPEP